MGGVAATEGQSKTKRVLEFSLILNFNIKENHSFLGLSWRLGQKNYLRLDVPQV